MRLVLVAVAVALVAYLGACWIVYDKLTATRNLCRGDASSLDNTPAAFDLPPADRLDSGPYRMPEFEDVRLPSREAGITVAGYWIPAAVADAPAVVFVPGHEGCRRDPTNLLVAGMLHRNDIGVLVIDLRDHGESTVEDGRFAGGTDEHRDVLGAWDWLRARGLSEDRIGVLGVSLGAATAMIAFGEEPRLAAIWEDSSYADIAVGIRAELDRNGYPAILTPGGLALARLFGDDLTSKSPLEAARKVRTRPIFITHGSLDERLSVRYAFDLAAAVREGGGEVEPWIAAGIRHTRALVLWPLEYERRLVEFFDAALGTAGP